MTGCPHHDNFKGKVQFSPSRAGLKQNWVSFFIYFNETGFLAISFEANQPTLNFETSAARLPF